MPQATLGFTLPEESHEFRAAAHVGDLLSAVQDVYAELRRRDKYGTAAERKLTAAEEPGIINFSNRKHDVISPIKKRSPLRNYFVPRSYFLAGQRRTFCVTILDKVAGPLLVADDNLG